MKDLLRPLTATALALGLAVTPALAQDKPGPAAATAAKPAADGATPGSEEWLRLRGETYHQAPESEQDPAEVSETARLNSQIAAQNAEADSLESQERDAYARAQDNYRQDVAEADRAEASYEAEVAETEAEAAERLRAQEVWENMIRACERSGRTDCRAAPRG